LVSNEYVAFYDFNSQPLIWSLREFMNNVPTFGSNSKDINWLTFLFSKRYHESNQKLHKDEATVHSLVVALLFLNKNLQVVFNTQWDGCYY